MPCPWAEGRRMRLRSREGIGVGVSKGTECSVLRTWSVCWPELCHIGEARLFKNMAWYQDKTENKIAG